MPEIAGEIKSISEWILVFGVLSAVSLVTWHTYLAGILKNIRNKDPKVHERLLNGKKVLWFDPSTVDWSDTEVIWRLSKGVFHGEYIEYLRPRSRFIYIVYGIFTVTVFVGFLMSIAWALLMSPIFLG